MEKLSMCRMCLVQNVNMYVVANKNLQDIYEKLTNIQFCTEDRRPMLACVFCCSKLQQCFRLQRKCLEAEKLFAQMLNDDYETNPLLNHDHFREYIITPTEHFSIPDESQTVSDDIKEELPDVCEGQDDENSAELDHEFQHIENVNIKSYHSETEDEVPLMEVKTEMEGEQEVNKKKRKANNVTIKFDHEFQHIENVNIKSYHSELKDDVPLMEVKTEMEGEQEVSKKKRKANNVTIKASVAKKPKTDIRRTKLDDTITGQQKKTEQPHSKNTIPSLNKSDKGTDSNDIIKYTRICIKDKPYKCEICPRSFSLKNHLTEHIRVHTGEKPYKCDICQRSFSNKSNFTHHVRIHTGDKPYKCEICQSSFSVRKNLTDHIRVHTGEKPYKCEICQRSFSVKTHLTLHIRVHTGEKPYKCDICQRSFSQTSNLRQHIRVHTGEKPFKCEICHRSFIQKSNLTEHIRIHTGDKPYKCEICQHSFAVKNNLTQHIRVHTGKNPTNANNF